MVEATIVHEGGSEVVNEFSKIEEEVDEETSRPVVTVKYPDTKNSKYTGGAITDVTPDEETTVTIVYEDGSVVVDDFFLVEEVNVFEIEDETAIRVWFTDPELDDSDYTDYAGGTITDVSSGHSCEENAIIWDEDMRREDDEIRVPATCRKCDFEFELVYTHDRNVNPITEDEI